MHGVISRRTLLNAAVAAGVALPVVAIGADPPAPLIVLVEYDPWRMVIGSDSPTFALYSNGLVIFAAKGGYQSAVLSATERWQLIERINAATVACFAGYHEIDDATDQPTNAFFLFGDGPEPTVATVYGRLDRRGAGQAPAPLIAAYEVIHGFSHPRARAWLPDTVEVMIWPYEHAPDESVRWPEGWPGLDAPTTVRRGGESRSIFLPAAHLSELRSLTKRMKPKGAVEIGGRKWALGFRYPFPGERLWMGKAKTHAAGACTARMRAKAKAKAS